MNGNWEIREKEEADPHLSLKRYYLTAKSLLPFGPLSITRLDDLTDMLNPQEKISLERAELAFLKDIQKPAKLSSEIQAAINKIRQIELPPEA